MAKSKIDWDLAKMLRLQGVSYEDIGKKLGVPGVNIRVKASREKWTNTVTEAQLIASQTVSGVVSQGVKERAEKWVNAMLDDLEETGDAIRKGSKPKSLMGLKLKEELMKYHVDRGRKLFGLDKDDNAKTQLAMIGSIHLYNAPNVTPTVTDVTDSQVVDVEDVSGGA